MSAARHRRGWSAVRWHLQEHPGFGPAHAGVLRSRIRRGSATGDPLRTGGGDPWNQQIKEFVVETAPHMWSHQFSSTPGLVQKSRLRAHAGVVRTRPRRTCRARHGPTHAGVVRIPAARPRRWTCRSPAHAGVFRTSGPISASSWGRPRARGGGVNGHRENPGRRQASWFLRAGGHQPETAVMRPMARAALRAPTADRSPQAQLRACAG